MAQVSALDFFGSVVPAKQVHFVNVVSRNVHRVVRIVAVNALIEFDIPGCKRATH